MYLANNGSIVVLVLSQDKNDTKYIAVRNGEIQPTTCATSTFKGKYPETNNDAQAIKDHALALLAPKKGVKISNAAIATLKPIATTLVPEKTTMKPTAPAKTAVVTKPGKPVAPATAPAKGTKVAAVVTKVAVEKPSKEPKESKAKNYADTAKITKLVKENPKRAGSSSFDRFEGYTGAKTVEQALANGVTRGDIDWDAKHGFISVEGWDVEVIEKKTKGE